MYLVRMKRTPKPKLLTAAELARDLRVSLRQAEQLCIEGAFPNAFHRVNNRQSEVSLWWAPGPFTFGVAWNHTFTHFKRANPLGGSESRENENDKIELISWFSF